MKQFIFRRWSLSVDPQATRAAFVKIEKGSPESCGCEPCLNFAASRITTYPAEFLTLLDALGIATDREAELSHFGNLGNGLHIYGGWFHFVGSILSGADARVLTGTNSWGFDLEPVSEHFSAGISERTALVNPALASRTVLQLEFQAEIPWVIEAAEPD